MTNNTKVRLHEKNFKKFYKAVVKQMIKKRHSQLAKGSFTDLSILNFLNGSLKKDLIDECVDKFIKKQIKKNDARFSLKKNNVPTNFFYK